jgi:hypothetical protein
VADGRARLPGHPGADHPWRTDRSIWQRRTPDRTAGRTAGHGRGAVSARERTVVDHRGVPCPDGRAGGRGMDTHVRPAADQVNRVPREQTPAVSRCRRGSHRAPGRPRREPTGARPATRWRPPRHRVRGRSRAGGRRRRRRSSSSSPVTENSLAKRSLPRPTPSVSRPPESRSSVAVSLATLTGRRRASGVTMGPRRMRWVAVAMAVSVIHGSATSMIGSRQRTWSQTNTPCQPASSASADRRATVAGRRARRRAAGTGLSAWAAPPRSRGSLAEAPARRDERLIRAEAKGRSWALPRTRRRGAGLRSELPRCRGGRRRGP